MTPNSSVGPRPNTPYHVLPLSYTYGHLLYFSLPFNLITFQVVCAILPNKEIRSITITLGNPIVPSWSQVYACVLLFFPFLNLSFCRGQTTTEYYTRIIVITEETGSSPWSNPTKCFFLCTVPCSSYWRSLVPFSKCWPKHLKTSSKYSNTCWMWSMLALLGGSMSLRMR